MEAPEGFTVTLSASEPDVVRPIAMAMDERGRLWVADGRNYPVRAPEGEGEDKILIFEDNTGDGEIDMRIVLIVGLNLVNDNVVGIVCVLVGTVPCLLFIMCAPDTYVPAV